MCTQPAKSASKKRNDHADFPLGTRQNLALPINAYLHFFKSNKNENDAFSTNIEKN